MSLNLVERESEAILQTYGRLPVEIDYANGCYIYDTDGNEYLDFLGGIAVNVLGHSHQEIIEAIVEQSNKYLHVSNFFFQKPQIELAEMLKYITGFDKVFYSNSGAESTEGALKFARKWGAIHNKKDVIAFTGGFHGRTYGALSLMEGENYKKDMGPFIDDVKILEFNSVEQLENLIDGNTAAVFIEFIQGSGGLTVADPEWVSKITELQEKYNFLVIADEVQSGLGRTGKFFSYEHFDVKPDIVTIAKGLGGGIPIGAILLNEKTSNLLGAGQHGTTFGGNALACATGLVVLKKLNEGLQTDINRIAAYLKKKLQELILKYPDKIKTYKGLGLMCGLEFYSPAKPIVLELLNRKIIANSTSNTVLRLVPPYIIDKTMVDRLISELDSILKEL
ncbi:MAG: aspartate aminotransferase family protein [Ignavibacteriae bacterium HGW-Ignavibacteriae-4]|nr:MAG: aspartate aminotransferase family protein [Ignavibacteriae bacterium HGW-Ignavibacteriae-4]